MHQLRVCAHFKLQYMKSQTIATVKLRIVWIKTPKRQFWSRNKNTCSGQQWCQKWIKNQKKQKTNKRKTHTADNNNVKKELKIKIKYIQFILDLQNWNVFIHIYFKYLLSNKFICCCVGLFAPLLRQNLNCIFKKCSLECILPECWLFDCCLI